METGCRKREISSQITEHAFESAIKISHKRISRVLSPRLSIEMLASNPSRTLELCLQEGGHPPNWGGFWHRFHGH